MYNINQHIWFILNNKPYAGTIVNHHSETGHAPEHYDIRMSLGGITGVIPDDIFESKENCIDALQKRTEDAVNAYMSNINSTTDLIDFMFNHTVSHCEEYTDWDAREAARRKAIEFGYTLSDNT